MFASFAVVGLLSLQGCGLFGGAKLTCETAEATAAGGRHPYDANKPWEWVYSEMCHSPEFWERELKDHADYFRFGQSGLGGLEGDAPVKAGTASSTLGTRESKVPPGDLDYVRRDAISRRDEPAGETAAKKPKVHHVGKDGLYSTNRNNNKLCEAFKKAGSCDATLVRVAKAGCGKGLHQCGKCLSRDHGAEACEKENPPKESPKKIWPKSKVRGKGRGK